MPDFEKVSDAQLVTAIARFSEVALAEVYRRHGGAVFGLAKRVMGNATEAEDVTQEIFLRLWNQPDRFDAARGLAALLPAGPGARSCRRRHPLVELARRRREAQRRLRHRSLSYDMQHEVWDMAVADQVSTAMGSLPVEERRAIELAYYDGRTYREVARCSGNRRGRSRAVSATACVACAPRWSMPA